MTTGKWLIGVPIVCCCVFVAMAQSQPPMPAPAVSNQKDQHQAAQEERKAEAHQQASAPFSAGVDSGNTKATAGDQQRASSQSKAEATTHWWAVAATVLNLVFTLGLVVLMFLQWLAMRAQARHMETGLTKTGDAVKAAQESADAATISANTAKHALETLERADVLIEMVMASAVPIADSTTVTVVLKNYGRTRAVNVNCYCTITILGLAQSPTIGTKVGPMIIGVGATNDSARFGPLGHWLNADTFDGISAGNMALRLTVEITYSNVFYSTRVHRTLCDGAFDKDIGAFQMRQTADD